MGYINAYEVLPEDLVARLQQYVEGQAIYIPKPRDHWRRWGEATDTRAYLRRRNARLLGDYRAGATISALAERYFLDPKSVRRILRTMQEA